MINGVLVTMALFFAYTEVKSNAQNLGFTCVISFCLVRTSPLHNAFSLTCRQNICYRKLYAYMLEVFHSTHRGTGNGISIGLDKAMGVVSVDFASSPDTTIPVPIHTCAVLCIITASVATTFSYEPMAKRSR
jgi:hypothetical protein